MKKTLLIIVTMLFACGIGLLIGYYMPTNDDGNDKTTTGKVTLYNYRELDYNQNLNVNKDGYKVLETIDNEEDYEDFINSYKYDSKQKQSEFKDYSKKYKYIMVGFDNKCIQDITPRKYKLEDGTLTINVDIAYPCGLCAIETSIYEFAVDKDLEFDKVKIKLNDVGAKCRDDVIY